MSGHPTPPADPFEVDWKHELVLGALAEAAERGPGT